MRRALITAALLFAAPATASAAPFGELPFRPVSGAATCLHATGAPGELVRWVRGGAEVLDARPDGLVPLTTVPLGKLRDCPVAVSDASGAGVLAGPAPRGIRVALREPGGVWGAPVTLGSKPANSVAIAVSARGDAVVAWVEPLTEETSGVHASRRAAGGAFGAPEQIGTISDYGQVAVAMAGDEVLATIADDEDVRLTTARPGGPFSAARRLVENDDFDDGPTLAAGADGRALLVATTDAGLVLFERDPGADFIRRPAIPGSSFDDVALALGPQGAAVVAWQSGGPGGEVSAMVRDSAVPFGAPVLVQRDEKQPAFGSDGIVSVSFGVDTGSTPYEGQTRLRAILGADGRALLAWGTEGRGARTATVTSAGRTEFGRLGTSVRDPAGVTPLLLAGGARAVAWADGYGLFTFAPSANRLHLAVEGAAEAPAVAAPQLSVGAPRDRTLRPSQPLLLPVRCRAACDVHATIRGQYAEPTIALPRAGTALLRFDPLISPVAPERGTSVRVALRWSAPGSRAVKQRTFAVPLRRLAAPPLPRIENLRARRLSGGRIDVRWSTDVAARDAYFYVYGTRTRSLRTGSRSLRVVGGRARRSFHVTLRDAKQARYVTVAVGQQVGERTRTAVIKVP